MSAGIAVGHARRDVFGKHCGQASLRLQAKKIGWESPFVPDFL
jgi:hypothetical protein